ncbi:hypothetical protein C5167_030116, partial [Papaver somniferum]
KNSDHKRKVLACFIQAVYLLELDRQTKRTPQTSLAPKWLEPSNYKLSQTLTDERDGSIFGAVLEWAGYGVLRPSGAPKAILALRGTLMYSTTMRRDFTDDLRLFVRKNLEGSVRFNASLKALKLSVDRFGYWNVCIAGHSLGAGFAIQMAPNFQILCVTIHLTRCKLVSKFLDYLSEEHAYCNISRLY